MKSKVLLLHDAVDSSAPLDELDTLEQVNQIEGALQRLGYHTQCKAFTGDVLALEHYLLQSGVDVVFNLVETYHGSQFLHLIPLLCEQLGIAVTGGNSEALFLTSDKLLAKRLMVLADIPTPAWISYENRENWNRFLQKKMICKPRREEASVGIDDGSVLVCETLTALESLVAHAHKHHVIIEEFIDGRECNVSLLVQEGQVQAMPIAEMLFIDFPPDKPKIVGYEAKWTESSFAYQHTQRSFAINTFEKELIQKLNTTAIDCWCLFGQPSYARVDFRIDRAKNVYVLEINVNPCIALDSGFVAAGFEKGYSYDSMVESIVKEALYAHAKFT
ncbi:MAG: ATP-grasp domain-containing protein [Sphaerochaetaceae bacterium]